MLSETQCLQAFPDLYHEIDRAVEDRRSNHVTLKETDDIPMANGYLRAMIYDQQVNTPILRSLRIAASSLGLLEEYCLTRNSYT